MGLNNMVGRWIFYKTNYWSNCVLGIVLHKFNFVSLTTTFHTDFNCAFFLEQQHSPRQGNPYRFSVATNRYSEYYANPDINMHTITLV